MTRYLLVVAVVLAIAFPVSGQETPRKAEVLVLGTYHMANPGNDIFNTKVDDVLSAKRQAEMTQLIEVLKRFRPTKIAVEANAFSKRTANEYDDYLAGKRELTRNEIDQIGFRLAKELGHKTVYAVDADGDFPYPRLVNHAKATGRSKELEELMGGFGVRVKEQEQYLATHTVLETLLQVNSDERVAHEGGLYYKMAHFNEPGDWAGADLLADWFRRNMRIYGNIVRLVESPEERILVIYGSGHLSWLQHFAANDPEVRLRKLGDIAK
jgi:hypothetical protein